MTVVRILVLWCLLGLVVSALCGMAFGPADLHDDERGGW